MALLILSGRPWELLGPARWPVGIALSATVGLLIVAVVRFRRRIYSYRYPRRRFRYVVVQRKLCYEIDNQNALNYSRLTTIRALQNDLREFWDRYYWTGSESTEPQAGEGVLAIHPAVPGGGMFDFFQVYFERNLSRGDVYDFEVTWPALQNWLTARPYVSATTEEPTQKITFELRIPRQCRASDVALAEEYRAAESRVPLNTREIKFDDDGTLIWTVHKPRLYRSYRVRWRWAGQPGHGPPKPVEPPGRE